MITFTLDGREVTAPENMMLVDAAKFGDVEIPVFCYEPKLGAPVGACRMCLVEIEGIPKLQTACSTPVKDGMVVHTQTERVRDGAGGGRRVPAHQPPARLPGLRQGRRVPAAGHLLRLGRRSLALHRAQAPLRQAAGAVAADRDRPRALHPLLPLRALQPGDRRGPPARPAGARRAHLRRDVRRPSLRRAVQRQHHRAVPGGRADLAALPLPRAPVGHRGRRLGLHAVPLAVQRQLHRARRARAARDRARQRRRRRRLAVRQGPLRLPVGARRRAHHRAAGARRRRAAPGELGARARRGRRGLGRANGRVGALAGGRRDQRGGLPPAAHRARGAATRPTSTARSGGTLPLELAAGARRAGRAGDGARPRVRPRGPRPRLRARRRRADPRPAHPQGRAPPRRAARGRHEPPVVAGRQRQAQRALRARAPARPSSPRWPARSPAAPTSVPSRAPRAPRRRRCVRWRRCCAAPARTS